MRRLVIETSGADCSIALIEDSEIVAERHEHVGRGHAERLIPWIGALPDGGRADEVIVGCGPGSFTGLRIAATVNGVVPDAAIPTIASSDVTSRLTVSIAASSSSSAPSTA